MFAKMVIVVCYGNISAHSYGAVLNQWEQFSTWEKLNQIGGIWNYLEWISSSFEKDGVFFSSQKTIQLTLLGVWRDTSPHQIIITARENVRDES